VPIVLVVEDEASIRDLFSRILASGGYFPMEASCAEEALAMLDAGLQPDAIMLDLKMPGMGGLGLLLRLRANPAQARIPIGIVTGDTFLSDMTLQAASALDAEMQFKPLTMEEVLDLAERLVARKRRMPVRAR
jgi:CheY-like chemotaxis protein